MQERAIRVASFGAAAASYLCVIDSIPEEVQAQERG